MYSILKSEEFRHAYHQALDHTEHNPEAQRLAARDVIDKYFEVQPVLPNTPFDPEAVYFTEHPIEVAGHYKFLVPGTIHPELAPGPLLRLVPKASPATRCVEAKQFSAAISAVEAVRLTLMPERINGIISFILDAMRFNEHHDMVSCERAIGTALDHFNRAANEGLRHITSESERGKRANEVAGTRRTLADLRKTLQAESHA